MGLRFKIALAAGFLAIGPVQAVLADPLTDGQLAAEHGDYGLAMRLWRTLADRGNVAAQYDLGVMYADHRGVPQSDARAMEWYRRAADGRYAKAQHALGDMYYLAVGVPQNYTRAVFWYRRSADQGFALGQGSLAIMYENGFGVPQDNVQAYMWFTLAGARDTAPGEIPSDESRSRAGVAAKMTPAQISEAQRLALEWKSK